MSSSPADRPPVRRRAARGHGGELRGRIVEVATEVLAETGDEQGMSIRAVAERAGVSPPAIYLHFSDKDALIAAVLDQLSADLDAALDAAVNAALEGALEGTSAGGHDPLAALLARARAFVEQGTAHPGRYKVLYERRGTAGAPTPVERLPARAVLQACAVDLDAAIAAGQVPAANAEVVVTLVWQLLHGIVSLRINKPHYPWRPVWQDTEHGVRALLGLHPPAH